MFKKLSKLGIIPNWELSTTDRFKVWLSTYQSKVEKYSKINKNIDSMTGQNATKRQFWQTDKSKWDRKKNIYMKKRMEVTAEWLLVFLTSPVLFICAFLEQTVPRQCKPKVATNLKVNLKESHEGKKKIPKNTQHRQLNKNKALHCISLFRKLNPGYTNMFPSWKGW